MSMLLTVQALMTKVGNPNRKLVLVKLADNANDEGICWPSYDYIADVCEMSRRTVIRHISDLEKMGLLSVRQRRGKNGNSSNIYHLHFRGDNLTPPSDKHDTLVVTEDHPPSDTVSPESVNEPVIEPIKNKQKDLGETESCFERLWAEFPTKKAKKHALAKFKAIVKAQSEPLEAFTKKLCQDIQTRKANHQFGFDKLHLTTYLNQERWNDDHETNQSSTAKPSHQQNRVDQHNAELLERYGHTATPSGRSGDPTEHTRLDSSQVCRGVRSEVAEQGTTIDLGSSDYHNVGE